MSSRDPWALHRWAIAAGREHGLSPIARHVLLILARYAGLETGECRPDIGTLAGDAARGDRQVRRALTELVAAGLIERHQRGRGQAAGTRLLAPAGSSTSGLNPPARSSTTAQDAPARTPATRQGQLPGHPRQSTPDTHDQASPDTHDRSLVNRPDERPVEQTPQLPKGGKEADHDFEAWLADHEQATGWTPPKPGTKARAALASSYRARRDEDWTDEDLRLATRGAMAHEYRREHGYTTADSVLRPTKIGDLVARGRHKANGTHPGQQTQNGHSTRTDCVTCHTELDQRNVGAAIGRCDPCAQAFAPDLFDDDAPEPETGNVEHIPAPLRRMDNVA